MRRFLSLLLCFLLVISLSGCGNYEPQADGKLNVVCTLFPYYDFVRQIGGDRVNVTLLVSAGKEAHSFEPTPLDIITISRSDLFIYNGGESELWVDEVITSSGSAIGCILNMMDESSVVYEEEEIIDGQRAGEDSAELEDEHHHEHHDEGEEEVDEHIWTSPVRAMELVSVIAEKMCALDPANAGYYKTQAESYLNKLALLDEAFRTTVSDADLSVMLFADRFPMLYFCREYGLDYAAAFHGCSSDTEPSLRTLKNLIDRVEDEHIPAIYTLELSSQKIANAIAETTGADILTFYSLQTISRQDFENGETYESLMWKNVEALKEGLYE